MQTQIEPRTTAEELDAMLAEVYADIPATAYEYQPRGLCPDVLCETCGRGPRDGYTVGCPECDQVAAMEAEHEARIAFA
jgi:hypothetical protein